MVSFVFFFQPFDDADRFVYTGLQNVNLLEAAYQSFAACEVTVVFFVSSGTDETDITSFQIRFQHVGGIHRTVTRTSGAYQIVYLVDVDNGMSLGTHSFHDALQTFFKVAAVLGSGQQCAQIQFINAASLQSFGNYA